MAEMADAVLFSDLMSSEDFLTEEATEGRDWVCGVKVSGEGERLLVLYAGGASGV